MEQAGWTIATAKSKFSELVEKAIELGPQTVTRHGRALPLAARRARLNTWLNEDLLHRFTTRVLPVDAQTADIGGRLIARAEEGGRPAAAMDAFIAATAAQHDPTVVTRNVADFSAFGVRLANPWRQTPPPTA